MNGVFNVLCISKACNLVGKENICQGMHAQNPAVLECALQAV